MNGKCIRKDVNRACWKDIGKFLTWIIHKEKTF